MALSVEVRELLADRGGLEVVEKLEIFALEALVENCGALEATWVGDLVRRVECPIGTSLRMGLLSSSTSKALW